MSIEVTHSSFRLGDYRVSFSITGGKMRVEWSPHTPRWTKAQARKFLPRYRKLRNAWIAASLPVGERAMAVNLNGDKTSIDIIEGIRTGDESCEN